MNRLLPERANAEAGGRRAVNEAPESSAQPQSPRSGNRLTLPELARMMRNAIIDRSYQTDTRLGSVVAQYLAWKEMGASARTLEIYEPYLARLCTMWADRDPAPDELTEDMLLEYLASYPAGSRKLVRTALRGFFKWAASPKRAHVPYNPVDDLPALREVGSKVYNVFSVAEQAMLVKAADALPMPRVERLRALCFIELGIRKEEARWLQPQDFDTTAKVVVVTHGKGGKQRTVPMGEDLWRAFVQYRNHPISRVRMSDRDGTWHEDRLPLDDDWLFFPYGVTKAGRVTWTDPRSQYSARSMHNWWLRNIEAAGVKYRSMHMNRHSVGTDLATAGADSFTIRDWLGHADVSTTQTYVHNSRSRLNTGRTRLDEFRKGQVQ